MSESLHTTHAPEIPRTPILKTLEMLLSAHPIVIVEGPDGMGKSTLLRQFAAQHAPNIVSVEVSAASRWAYDPRVIKEELVDQLADLVGSASLDSPSADWKIKYSGLLAQLRRRSVRKAETCYFVVDGLEDIPSTEEATRAEILELLPFGQQAFKFVLSARSIDDLPLAPAARKLAKVYPAVSFFSAEEAARYLHGFSLSPEQVGEIMRVTQGFPGRLASIRRMLAAGQAPDQLLTNLSAQVGDLFALEWASVDSADEELMLILAVLTHGNRAYKAVDISVMTGIPAARIQQKLQRLPLVTSHADGTYAFPAEAARQFIARKAQYMRSQVNDLLIAYYNRDPDSPDAIAELPQLFFAAEDKLLDLVEFLSPDRFARIYKNAKSVTFVKQQAEMGIHAASRLNRTGDMVRFTLQRATIEEVASSDVAVAEVRARTATGDYDTAIALAEAAPRHDLQLHLLVAMARVLKEHGVTIEYDLQTRITELLSSVDARSLGRRLSDIVGDLFYVAPERAIELAGGSIDGVRGENAIDWAITSLAIQAQIEAQRTEADPNAKQHAKVLHDQIQDPKLKQLSRHAIAVLGKLSAVEVLTEAAKLESTGDKLYFLQHWMSANRTRSDASQVLEQGVRIAVQATNYTATAKVYRELAYCLPHISEPERLYELVDLLDAQRGALEKVGPPEEYIRLRLIIARAIYIHDQSAGQDRFNDVYNEVTRIEDPVVQVAVWARVSAALARVDPTRRMDETIHALVEAELDAGLETVLQESADHYDVCRGVIDALAVPRPTHALDVIRRINTEWRRDMACQTFVDAAVAVPASEISAQAIESALDMIVDPDLEDQAVIALALALKGKRLAATEVSQLTPLFLRAATMHDPTWRVRLCTMLAASVEAVQPGLTRLRQQLLNAAWSSWSMLADDWGRLETGLEALAAIARTDSAMAAQYVDKTNALKGRLSVLDSETAIAAHLGIMLALRAFGGVVRHRIEGGEDLDRLFRIIDQCGSALDKGRLLAELAIRCHFAQRDDLCQHIVQQRVLPMITAMSDAEYECRQLVIDTAPALYVGAPAAFRAQLPAIDPIAQDTALSAVAWTLLNRVPLTDAFEYSDRSGARITYDQACAVLEVLREMHSDVEIYSLLVKLVDATSAQGSLLSRPQKAHLAKLIEEFAVEKFPSQRFIQHKGYRIIAQAQATRLQVGSSTARLEELATEGRKIPNKADRGFVMAVIAGLVGDVRLRRVLIAESREIAATIPILLDRIDRYEMLSRTLAVREPSISKDMLREALHLAQRGEGASVEQRRRSLINLAYRIDPEYAASLAQGSDDDPGKSTVERQIQLLKLRDTIAVRRPSDDAPSGTPGEYARAAWLKLGSLNAERISPVAPDRILALLQQALSESLSRAYPLFAYFIENAVQWSVNDAMVRKHVLPLFEACLRAAELALMTSPSVSSTNVIPSPDTTVIIDSGEREKALAVLRDWLKRQGAGTEFFIVEPYFYPEDILLLNIINEMVEEPRIKLITSHKSVERLESPYEDQYRAAWRQVRSDPLPETTIIVVATRQSKKFPPHDRWWFVRGGGVQLGTSYGGLGMRISTVRVMSEDEANGAWQRMAGFFNYDRGEYQGEKVLYSNFMLE